MKNLHLGPENIRSEADVFSRLRILCASPGYIHAVSYFCWRDNLIRYSGNQAVEKDFEHQYSADRLLRTEISTLIGLLVQQTIDSALPTPSNMQRYIDETQKLLHELHQALTKPWFEGWDFSGELPKAPEVDPFASASGLREPIFYGGESAYDFQYRDFSRLKYASDAHWLNENKSFVIDDACRLADALQSLEMERHKNFSGTLEKTHPDKWTTLDCYMFTLAEAKVASGLSDDKVEAILAAFSYGPDDRNSSFTALNEFNATNSAPILKFTDGSYALFQNYSFKEAIYESPFFWMAGDKSYAETASANRGIFTESFVTDRLTTVFGPSRVFRNVDIYKGKNRFSEADTLVLYGDHALIVQAKSKRLTIEARKGNDLQLKDDFKKAIQNAYDQALLCAEALIGDDFKFICQTGTEITINKKPSVIFPICVVSDHYPALAFQARQFLKAKNTPSFKPPLATDVFTIDVMTEMLDSPLHFLNYLALRARVDGKILVSQELTTLGFHLKHNLWLDSKYDMVNLGEDFGGSLDIAMLARRNGFPGEKTPKGLLTRFDGLTIGALFSAIERAASPQLTGIGLLFLQLSTKTAKALSRGIDQIIAASRRDHENHDLSIAIDGGGGITVHCNSLPEAIARDRLIAHCKVRKYDTQGDVWHGLLLDPATGMIRGATTIDEKWQPNGEMDAIMAKWPKRNPVPISRLKSRPKKIGRNDSCPCGSGKKYKRCHGSPIGN
ncbi:Preprotein translocase subunit SecA (ATPase, RNA helicase) [Tardiphaga sp. OK245]|nr:Preprotein translocase subunit SecA (ATPase, RNA helicase) [Tardiphaga sp. OK245]